MTGLGVDATVTDAPSTPAVAPDPVAASGQGDLWVVALVVLLLVLGFVLVYAWPRKDKEGRPQKRAMSPTFARVYGLLVLAGLATMLSFASVREAALTPAFTLLGTIAGYLAGAKASAVSTGSKPGDGNGAPSLGGTSLELN